MSKSRPPAAVLLEPDLGRVYSSLVGEDELKKLIDKAADILKYNMSAGKKIRKRQIPRYYIDKFSVNNLYRLRLERDCRCIYALAADEESVNVVVLEIFTDHKSYARRFGYRE